MSIPASALAGGPGGNDALDSPGTTPPPHSVNEPLGQSAGGGGGVAGDAQEGDAPIPFPGQEDAAEGVAEEQARLTATSLEATPDEPEEDHEEEEEEEQEEEEEEEEDEDGASGDDEDQADISMADGSMAADGSSSKKSRGRPKGSKHPLASGSEEKAKATGAGKGKKTTAASKAASMRLPTARVKKIIMSDPDVDACGKEATFAIGKACEIYIHHLVDSAYTQARLSQRKAIVYKDVSQAIRSTPHLEFLMDVVPNTMPLSAALQEKRRHEGYANGTMEESIAGQGGEQQGAGSLDPMTSQDTATYQGAAAPSSSSSVPDHHLGATPLLDDTGRASSSSTPGDGIQTHSQLTADGRKINKKGKGIRKNKQLQQQLQEQGSGEGTAEASSMSDEEGDDDDEARRKRLMTTAPSSTTQADLPTARGGAIDEQMDLDAAGLNHMQDHGLPPAAAQATADSLKGTSGHTELVE